MPKMSVFENHHLVSHVRHKTNPLVYGAVVSTYGKLYFHQWKWPKSPPPRKDSDPERTTEVRVTSKPVDESIWDSFDRISLKEFVEIETMDMVNS